MDKILVILQKEWLEIRQQRGLMLGVLLPPLLFTLIPLGIIYLSGSLVSNGGLSSPGKSFPGPAFAGMTTAEQGQAMLGSQFSIFYVLLPVLITSIIASYSIVGEKTSRTLEPLLATPVRTWELLLSKCLAALIPGLAVTWVSGTLFIIGTAAFAISGRVFSAIVSPGWLVVFLLWTPLLGTIAIVAMLAISSRVNDPRTAQQLSVWIIVPFFAMFFGELAGLQVLGLGFTLSVVVVLVILAVLSIWGASRLFQREVILTRWK
jgi:ABC-2 type transport system permease protein